MILNLLDSSQNKIEPQCSRASCANKAEFKIIWRNPKIHDESRQKTWLACAEHKDYLTEFLKARNFPTRTEFFTEDGDKSDC